MDTILAVQELIRVMGDVMVLAIYVYALYKGIMKLKLNRDITIEFPENSDQEKPAS